MNHKIAAFILSLAFGTCWVACDKIGADIMPQTTGSLPSTMYVEANSTGILDLSVAAPANGNAQIGLTKDPANGSVTIKDQFLRYEPAWYFQNGVDSFTLTVNGVITKIQAIVGDSASLSCKIGLLPISAVVRVGVPVTLKAYAYEKFCKGGDDATLRIDQYAKHGNGNPVPGNATIYYQPTPTFVGVDRMIYSFASKDPAEGRAYAEAKITVTDLDDCIVSLNDAGVLWKPKPGETSFTFDFPSRSRWCNLDSSLYFLSVPPLNGKALLYTSTQIKYTPNKLQTGTDLINYKVYTRKFANDNTNADYDVHFKIAVVVDSAGAACPTILLNDFTTTAVGTKTLVDVFANDNVCSDQDRATLSIIQPPKNGVAAIENGKIAYTPNAGFSGIDTFLYGIKDANNRAYQTGVKMFVQ